MGSNRCHFCECLVKAKFEYDVRGNVDSANRKSVPVCRTHFNVLCNMTYPHSESDYFPVGQKEYISVKRLESQLDVINTIQFK